MTYGKFPSPIRVDTEKIRKSHYHLCVDAPSLQHTKALPSCLAARASEEYLIGTPYEFGLWRRRRARRQAAGIGTCEVIALIERVKQGAMK